MKNLTISLRAIGVAQVTMSRPVMFNAFDEAMVTGMDAAFSQLAGHPGVRMTVLAGEGRHFSAGAYAPQSAPCANTFLKPPARSGWAMDCWLV